jgi:hypothetical protein
MNRCALEYMLALESRTRSQSLDTTLKAGSLSGIALARFGKDE